MPKRNKNHFHISGFLGGAKRDLIEQVIGDPNTEVIVFDNHNEIALHRDFYNQHGVRYFELGPNSTSHLLVEDADPEVKAHAEHTANFGTDYGKGARPTFGYEAAKARILFPDFVEYLDQLTNHIYVVTNGRPELCDITWHCSLAGATGGGALKVLDRVLTETISKTGLVVHSKFDLLGSTTFMGASTRARQTGAACLAAATSMTCFPEPTEKRTARTLMLSEHPPFGRDQSARNRVLNIEEQANTCSDLQREMSTRRPNDAATNQLGNVYSREMDVIGSIPENEIVGQVAKSLSNEFEKRIGAIGHYPGMISEVFVEHTTQDLQRPDIESIFEIAEGSELNDLVERLRQPGQVNHLQLFCQMNDGNRLDLGQISHDFGQLPSSVEGAVSQINLLHATRQVVADELDRCRSQIEMLEQLADQTEQELDYCFRKAFSGWSFWRNARIEKFTQKMEELRRIADESGFQMDLEQVLNAALEETEDLIDVHETSLAVIRDALAESRPSGFGRMAGKLVEVAPLDTVFSQLLELKDLSPENRKARLAKFATHVTVKSYTRMLGIWDSRYQKIAKALLNKSPEIVGPPLGGKQRHEPTTGFLVLPNTSPEVKESLVGELKRLAPDVQVCFTDTISFGVAAVKFRFRQFRSVADIFDGQLIHDLNAALQDNVWRLNFINGLEDIQKLGGQIIDGRIEFPSDSKP